MDLEQAQTLNQGTARGQSVGEQKEGNECDLQRFKPHMILGFRGISFPFSSHIFQYVKLEESLTDISHCLLEVMLLVQLLCGGVDCGCLNANRSHCQGVSNRFN